MTNSEQIVYISCVEEVRLSFVSHLSEALYQKGITDVFVDSKDLLSEEAQEKVERSRVSVMILPGNRTVCLDKLLKVLRCQRNKGQVVVPVLYGYSPLQGEWLSALDSEGLPSVHRSRKDCTDSELVKEITRDVDEKLFSMEQIGIYSKLLEIGSMVCKQPFGVRCVGIWGMPGIGKTTLAKAVFKQMSGDFDAYCFIEDCDRVIYEKGLYRLLEEQFSKEKPDAGGSITKLSLLRNKLNNKRVLVVLDDVRNPLIAEPLLGGSDWFGPESLIIITSRDKQVFRICQVDQIYEVKGLNEKEALQLFLLSASIKDKEEQNLYHELSMKVIEYANGNPLALNTYGRELKDKKKLSEMETAFLKLKRSPPFTIADAFKSSYDSLNDSEMNIFLDIACFFQGENVNYVMQLLEGCGFFPHVGIAVLVEKHLVTISDNCVRMHNLIQDVGRQIIIRETVQIQRRSRLWEPWSIKYLLEDNEPKTSSECAQGNKEIEGMFLDTANLSFDVKPAAFENMFNLRLLKIYCSNPEIHPVINFPNGSLHSLPNELRLLHWENYPAKGLPQNFDPRNLVEINMPYSQLETLWAGTKNLVKLRMIRLCHSQQLVDVGDLSKAQNLEVVDLQGCTRLQSFPATGQLLHLQVVNLSGCIAIKSFPEIPPNIETLHLQGTGIRKLPIVKLNGGELVSLSKFKDLSNDLKLKRLISLEKSSSSNQDLNKLICLELKNCSRLRSLPNMVNLELLKVLDLSGCSELKTIHGFPRNLKEVYLAGTAIRKVPQLPQSLELFNAHGCVSLKSIRLDSKKFPMHYTFSNCFDLSPYMVSDFLVKVLANAKHISRERQQELNEALAFSFCGPSPPNQNSTLDLQPGSSVAARLNPSWRNMLVGFAMLVEVAFSEDYYDATGFGIRCVCRWKNKEGHSQRIEKNMQCWAPGKAVPKVQKDHIFVFVDVNMRPSTDEGNDPSSWADLVVFEFFPISKQTKPLDDSCTVTRCGVRIINAATGNTSLEDISPVLSLDPMEVSGNEVEKVLRVSYDSLPEMNKDLFLYLACLFNDEDIDLPAPFIPSIDLDVGLKDLANRSLIRVSSNREIVMHVLPRRMGSSKKIERLVGNSLNSMINAKKIEVTHSENPENWTKYPSYVPITNSPKVEEMPTRPTVGKEVGFVGLHGTSGVGKTTLLKKFNNMIEKLFRRRSRSSKNSMINSKDPSYVSITNSPEVVEMPTQLTVGQEEMFSKAWNRLMEHGVGIMGLHGMGGVGKTTLFKKINNKFATISGRFEVVIWVVVSQGAQISKLQEDIAQKLHLCDDEWRTKNESDKAADILKVLKGKRFVLMLDDIWEKVDLEAIGVPFPTRKNGCKVAFTTRSRNVCGSMGDHEPMEVKCLGQDEAWELFKNKVGENRLIRDPLIVELARKVTEKCCGLPLALSVIGETMACKTTREEWKYAIEVLTRSAAEFSDMENRILPILKFSYDSLKDEHIKSCFLYCALFPEEDEISKENLIDYWICEGFIGEGLIKRDTNKGYGVLGTLIRANLLMEVDTRNVKMHDVVRDMALWIASDFGQQKETFIVQAGVGLREIPKEVKDWGAVRRMSLMSNDIREITCASKCSQLTTLFLQNNRLLKNLSGEFIRSMQKLVVLDLSDNEDFNELPEQISELASLQFLDLSSTSIEQLPVGFQELKKLTHLNLSYTDRLCSLSGISKLSSLRILKLLYSKVDGDVSLLKELQLLEHLQVLTITISTELGLKQLSDDQRLANCIEALGIDGFQQKPLDISLLASMENLRQLRVENSHVWEINTDIKWSEIETNFSFIQNLTRPCFTNLSSVVISKCNGIMDLTWLLFAPNLVSLGIHDLDDVEEIINKETATNLTGMTPFQKLEFLYLDQMPKLESIYWSPLPFPFLKWISVEDCPKLRKLPLNAESVPLKQGGRFSIYMTPREQKYDLEWEDEDTKNRFRPVFY